MPYKDPEAKRRYMAQYYQQKIKTGEIPCTAHRKGSYGLTHSFANKTQVVGYFQANDRTACCTREFDG